jgi:hypothetical protein
MHGLAESSGRMWRQLAASVLIFALLFQGMMFAVAGAQIATDAVNSVDWTGSPLCRHDGGNGTAPESPAADQHCIFCVLGATCALGAPSDAPEFHIVLIATTPWPLTAWRLALTTVDASARPRGPPAAV